MSIDSKTVFLMSCQREILVDGGIRQVSSTIEQRIVVAPDISEAYRVLSTIEPELNAIGCATLDDYEQTATKIWSAIHGNNSSWKVLIASNTIVQQTVKGP